MKTTISLILCCLSFMALAKSDRVNVYSWSDYIPTVVIQQFEKETGITVNLSEYNSNETLYAKLRTDPQAGYDIIIPSSYYVDRMKKEGMLHMLNKALLFNLKHFNPLLLNKPFDRGNKYSLPYLWGSTGIVVNKKYHSPKKITRWSDFWNKKYKNQLLLLNDPRGVFDMALITLGYMPDDTNPEHIKQAYLKLKQLLPNVRLFNSTAVTNIYTDGDISLGMGWNGDVYQAYRENPNLVFIYPEEGFMMWIDCLAIPKNAPNLDNAYKFINFITRPDIAAKISEIQGYSSPNLAAMKLLPKKMRDNPMVNPSPEILKRGKLQRYIGSALQIYEKYWEMLKTDA